MHHLEAWALLVGDGGCLFPFQSQMLLIINVPTLLTGEKVLGGFTVLYIRPVVTVAKLSSSPTEVLSKRQWLSNFTLRIPL